MCLCVRCGFPSGTTLGGLRVIIWAKWGYYLGQGHVHPIFKVALACLQTFNYNYWFCLLLRTITDFSTLGLSAKRGIGANLTTFSRFLENSVFQALQNIIKVGGLRDFVGFCCQTRKIFKMITWQSGGWVCGPPKFPQRYHLFFSFVEPPVFLVQNWISLFFLERMARIQKKEGFRRTPPNCYGPSSSLSNLDKTQPKTLQMLSDDGATHVERVLSPCRTVV